MRLPFGLSTCIDDVRVQGSTEERQDIHLLKTCQAGLKFNPQKYFIQKQENEYLGRVITMQGVQPYPK